MAISRKLFNFALKKYRALMKYRNEQRAGFKAIKQHEAYMMEPKLTINEKRHYCERKAFAQLGYFPDLDNPRAYNEKIIWLALNYKNPKINICADKYEMKAYLNSILEEDYTIPSLGLYTNVNQIPFDELPSKFVIKSTAGWGGKHVILVKDKSKTNIDRVKSKAAEWLYPWNNYYYNNLCITDENIAPRVLVEEYIGEGDYIDDYKVFCFNGRPKLLLLVRGRHTKKVTKTFIDIESWNVLPVWRNNSKYEKTVEKPQKLQEMLEISEKISKEFPLLRIDFFIHEDRLYVGELTFSPGMFLKLNPREWDYKFGEFLKLDGRIEDFNEEIY